MKPPRGLPDRVWVVVLPTGERHIIDKPFLDGITKWAEGMDVTIAEYVFIEIVHRPPDTDL